MKALAFQRLKFQVKFSMTIRQCLLWSFQMFFLISVRIRTCQIQSLSSLSSFNLNPSMLLFCTVSCGRLFHSRSALIVKKFFRISRFALRTTTLHALPLESLSFRSNSFAVAFLDKNHSRFYIFLSLFLFSFCIPAMIDSVL